MQKLLLANMAVVGLFGASALASDLPTKAPSYQAPTASSSYNWSGLYVGANFGSGWTSGSLNIPGNSFYGGTTELIGGGQVGYNVQAGQFLFGVESDFDWSSFDHPALPIPTLGSVSQHWISTVAGRFGLVNDRWLVYGKLGGGWVGSTASLNSPGASWSGSSTDAGWLIGGGIEYGFKSHWTVKLEYDYLTQSNWLSGATPAVALSRDVQTVKAGINYKFESGVSSDPSGGGGSAEPSEDLQKQSQNPIADLVSVPFQSNTNFDAGPFNRTQEVLNIQPVVPMHLSNDWNLISRTIIPLMGQPDPLSNGSTSASATLPNRYFCRPRIRVI